MAQRRVFELIDDLTGQKINNGKVVYFGFGGRDYKIDLTISNAQEFANLLKPYIKNAKQVKKPRQTAKPQRPSASKTAKIRAWARQNGQQVSARGPLRPEITTAYKNAHQQLGL